MTELKKFLFDFDFDDIQLMEAIDQAESEEDLAPEEDVGIEPVVPVYSGSPNTVVTAVSDTPTGSSGGSDKLDASEYPVD